MADIGTLNPEQMLQQQQILRQQKMAEMLMQQGMQQPQGQMVSGRYVAPSIFQNLAGLANVYMGQRGIEKKKDPKTWNPQQAALAQKIVESKTSAGASKYDFGNMINKSLSDVAPMLVASKTATSGAIQQADAANRIIQSLDTNKLFTGAGANQKLQAAQIGQMLGVTGNKTEEIVANTRQAIQGLAQLTLQGRKQMRGEGAITESEGALAQRAMSGDISLTAGELRILANAAKRSAKFTYDQHQSMMGALAKDSPNSVPYYQLEVNPSIFGESTSDVRAKADAILNKPKP
jgi:hypothetical protein